MTVLYLWCALSAFGCGRIGFDNIASDAATDASADTDASVAVSLTVVAIAAGARHACALFGDGATYCWGDNARGQLGTGDRLSSSIPVAVDAPEAMISVAGGLEHTCAIGESGAVYCWGSGASGQLGDGTFNGSNLPRATSPLPGMAVQLDLGKRHSCATLDNGSRYCWGYNAFGGFGLGTTDAKESPVAVPGLAGASSFSGGDGHLCGIFDARLECAGANDKGQLGDSSMIQREQFAAVPGLSDGVIAAATADDSAAAVTATEAYRWGDRLSGVGSPGATNALSPMLLDSFASATPPRLVMAKTHACFVVDSGVFCWGSNIEGSLGTPGLAAGKHGSTRAEAVPTDIDQLVLGDGFSCFFRGGVVSCFGRNDIGQLGDGTTEPHQQPAAVTLP